MRPGPKRCHAWVKCRPVVQSPNSDATRPSPLGPGFPLEFVVTHCLRPWSHRHQQADILRILQDPWVNTSRQNISGLYQDISGISVASVNWNILALHPGAKPVYFSILVDGATGKNTGFWCEGDRIHAQGTSDAYTVLTYTAYIRLHHSQIFSGQYHHSHHQHSYPLVN